ncbi:S1C family serine protease [Ornithinibacillus contaminans]|uniref:S1C family serine protease n=1 Tax=Ornithinibacillus contaminans TaxID=694055 RepID=UPI00064DB458|nr:trypsin-like peptidase domain-containing protein [Ornithinibacillus contaminans]
MQLKQKYPLIATIIIAILGLSFFIYLFVDWQSQDLVINNPIINQVQTDDGTLDLKTIVHEAEKNVVQIEAKNEDETLTGSGFLYNEKGDIITNAHVVKDAETIYVRTANARFYPAAVIGIGDNTDVAVIRVPQLAGLTGLSIDRETMAEIGDEVIALGSPHGFQNTVTLGIISGTEREFTVDGFDYHNNYQISAQITHGNSGGPLINRATGKVIGINSVGTDDGTLGFSIPIIDVIATIETWSNEAQNDQLTYTSTEDLLSTIDSKQFMQDAEYVMEYFLDSIIIRDYVGAYSLLGDSYQSSTSYSSFREGYIQIVDMEYAAETTEIIDENHASVIADVTITKNQLDEEEQIKETVRYQFTIGYENDQLKIISLETLKN